MSALRVAPPGRVSPARLWTFAAGILLFAVLIVLKMWNLQIVRSEPARRLARQQQEQIVPADPRRGRILDRMGRALAVSTDVFSVYAAPEEIQDVEAAAAALGRTLTLPADQVRQKLTSGVFVPLRRRVAPDTADRVRDLRIPGIHLVRESKRFYPRGTLASHVIGFVVPDQPNLREGLERRYEAEIRGTPGALVALRDARGKQFLVEARREAVPGRDLAVSLDEVIQHTAERELAAAIQENGARSGSVVVLHTPTGEVLAMANWPYFNPNRYGLSQPAERRNLSVTDYYEPGSTFKMITAAAALEEGLVRPSEVIDCQMGLVRVAGVPIHDHKPFGLLSFTQVIADSSNIGALKVGMRLSQSTFHGYISRFGFGERTGVDLPGEARGMLRPPSRWAATSGAYIAFGQEIGVTPLQLASAFSTIANRGVRVQPRVVTRILEPDGRGGREPDHAAPRRAITESTADTLIDLMEEVVRDGTGTKAAVPGYRVAGKTGTAQKIVGGVYAPDKHVASFCGFVPSRRPVLTILIVVDEPQGVLYHGGDVAAPVFRRIAEPVLDYLGVAPDARPDAPVEIASLGAGLAAAAGGAAEDPAAIAPAGLTRAGLPAAGGKRGGDGRIRKGAEKDPRGWDPPQIVLVAPRPLDLRDDREEAAPAAGSVPDLEGAPLRDAVVALARVGLRARIEAGRADGFVVSQSPAAGSAGAPGAEVTIVLGRSVLEIAPHPEEGAPGAGAARGRAASRDMSPPAKKGSGGGKAARER